MSRESTHEVGLVVKSKRYLLTIEGLPSAKVNDVLVNQHGNRAIVRALSDEYVHALALSGEAEPGDRYQFSPEQHLYSCGDHLFGRVIDTFGTPIDNKGSFPPNNTPFKLEVEAPGIEVRQPIHEQLVTGVSVVDTLVPIAKGQRQMLFGPMRSGKTTFLTQSVQAQANEGTVCIYAVIGKPINGLRKVTDAIINDEQTHSKTIVIAALSDEPASVIALAPSVAFLLAEYFQAQGEHVLVILDDLDAHAKYLREIALLEGRLPSMESYPGDIFYQHAHLMERSGHFTEAVGGGSITALPIVQTDLKNFSDLIPTNIMACTDGHLAFVPELRAEGYYPSISIEESVTRVGRQSQHTLQKQLTLHAQMLLGQYRTQEEYAKFSADVSEQAKRILEEGRVLVQLLEQPAYQYRAKETQVMLLALAFTDFFKGISEDNVAAVRDTLVKVLNHDKRFAPLRTLVVNDDATWEQFLKAVRDVHSILQPYVDHH